MHPEGPTVRRALYWVACGLVALNLPLSAGRTLATPTAYRPGFAPATLGVIAFLLTWAIWRCTRRLDAALPLQLLCAGSYIALLLHRWTLGPDVDSYPPLMHVLGAGMCISSVLGVRAAYLLIPLFAVQVALIRAPFMDLQSAIGEAGLLALSGWIATACVHVLQRAGQTVEDAVAATVRLQEDEVRAQRRRVERERWDGLVHDKVLGALQLAVRSPDGTVPATARELAAQALTSFRGDPGAPVRPAVTSWQEHAVRWGLEVRILVSGEVSDTDVHQALVEAVNEALTNVAKHSGQNRATVSGSLSSAHASVVVSDRGAGFPVAAHRFRAGIRSSIQARMQAVGGTATVISHPGAGTRVTLSWDAHRSPSGPTPTDWQLRAFAPMMLLGAGVVVLNVLMGRSQWAASNHPVLALLGIAAVVATTSVATFIEPTARQGAVLAATSTVTAAVLATDTPAGATFAWRYWYLGALTPAVGALAFRYPRGIGLAAAVAMTSGVVGADLLNDAAFLSCLTGPVPVLLATTIAGHLLRQAMDRTWGAVAQAAAQDADLRLAIAAQEIRSQEAAARVRQLRSSVGPALDELAGAKHLSIERTRELALLESSARDQLTAPDLLDDDLTEALRSARERGVRVEVVSTGSPDGDDPALDRFRAVLLHLLHHAAPPLRVRVVWRPHHEAVASSSTITAIGQSAGPLGQVLRRSGALAIPPTAATVSGDESWLLVDFSPTVARS